ncbi:MAG: NAD(P)-dependent oxidoreductase, partial [Deltaproteobacteria bacterium]|nr:NAD(P)-dependent oxidoreductase [Deltaproteobacteria bacterium]
MRIFVTGVTGQLGRVLAKTLSKRHEVVGLARPNSQTQQVVANLSKLVLGDLLYPEGFIDEVAVCDCIIFNAAVYRDSGVNTDTYFKVNVGSLARVFELLRKRGNVRAKKAILVSTNAVHDLTKDKPVTETSPYRPADYYQYSKLLAEFEFLKWVEILGFQGNIVRPAMIWGDG